MKTEMKLTHPAFGLCDTAIATDEQGKEKIILGWRYRYGKTIDKCTIVSKELPNPRDRAVIYKLTKDWYPSADVAAKDLGISANSVRLHCQREFNPKLNNKFKYA